MVSYLLKQSSLRADEIVQHAYQFAHEYDREYGDTGYGRGRSAVLPKDEFRRILTDKAMNSIVNCNEDDAHRVAITVEKILETMGINVKVASNHKIPTLYHGTAKKNLLLIRKEGLNPTSTQWKNMENGSDAVYLTNDKFTAQNYSGMHGVKDKDWVILQIDGSKLREDLLGPDDYEFPEFWENNASESVKNSWGYNWNDTPWWVSLKYVNQVMYNGVIPPNAISVTSKIAVSEESHQMNMEISALDPQRNVQQGGDNFGGGWDNNEPDKEYWNPFGDKGTEPENNKFGAKKKGFTSSLLQIQASPKCPHCGSTDYGLMPSDFETAKCNKCGKNWNHGIVPGINDPSDKTAAIRGDEAVDFYKPTTSLAPRMDLRTHIDENQIDNPVKDDRELDKKKMEGPTPSTGHMPLRDQLANRSLFASDNDEYWVALVQEREENAKANFMESPDIQQIAQDNGWTMGQAWDELGRDFANELYDPRNRIVG